MVTADVGNTVTVAPVLMVTVAVSFLVVSVLLMASTVTVKEVALVFGAVYFPVVSIVPIVALPPNVLLTYHLTPPVSEVGVIEYANWAELCSFTVAVLGLTVTTIVVLPPPHPACMITRPKNTDQPVNWHHLLLAHCFRTPPNIAPSFLMYPIPGCDPADIL